MIEFVSGLSGSEVFLIAYILGSVTAYMAARAWHRAQASEEEEEGMTTRHVIREIEKQSQCRGGARILCALNVVLEELKKQEIEKEWDRHNSVIGKAKPE